MVGIETSLKCLKCKTGKMELFGVTESGQYKYACTRCYHYIEREKYAEKENKGQVLHKKRERKGQDDS